MNPITIDLDREDISKAIREYVAKKYPNVKVKSLWVEFNVSNQEGRIVGNIIDNIPKFESRKE